MRRVFLMHRHLYAALQVSGRGVVKSPWLSQKVLGFKLGYKDYTCAVYYMTQYKTYTVSCFCM